MNLVSATRQLAAFDPSTPGRFSGVHRGAILYAGLPVEDADLETLIPETQNAHLKLPELLLKAFTEVAETAGIAVRDERTA